MQKGRLLPFGCMLALSVTTAWGQCSTGASTGVTVDAALSSHNSRSVHAANYGSQTFTVNGSGCYKLNAVTVNVRKEGNPPNGLTIEVRNVVSGSPGTIVLASKTGVAIAATQYDVATTINFDAPPEISGGVQYALVVYTIGGNANNSYRLGLASGNSYTGGKYCKSDDSGASWAQCFNGDLDVQMSICVTQCPGRCVRSQGYWKTHASDWTGPLTLGTREYIQTELLSILHSPTQGNGLVSLAHQLIAAKLNVASGAAVPTGVAAAISASDQMIGSLVIPPFGNGSLPTSSTESLKNTLDQYNNGLYAGGPAHCATQY